MHRSVITEPEQRSFFSKFFFPKAQEVPSPSPPTHRVERPTFWIQDYLPPPLEDRTIQRQAEQIQEHLQNHVEHFYTDNTTTTEPIYENLEDSVTSKSSFDPSTSIKAEIKRVVAVRLIRGIQPFADSDEAGTLLPTEITRFLRIVPDPADIKDDKGLSIQRVPPFVQLLTSTSLHKHLKPMESLELVPDDSFRSSRG